MEKFLMNGMDSISFNKSTNPQSTIHKKSQIQIKKVTFDLKKVIFKLKKVTFKIKKNSHYMEYGL